MHRRAIILGAAAAAALAACSRDQGEEKGAADGAGSGASIDDPAAAIRPLYDPYLTQGAPFPAFRDQAPWSADLWTQLEAMVARSSAINEPILDFDPLIGAQDGRLSNLSVTTDSVVPNSHAVVRARFTNLGREEEIVYDLVWEGGGWRVDNVRGRDWDLRQIAAQPSAGPPPP